LPRISPVRDLLTIRQELEARPALARRAARIAINDTTTRMALPMYRKEMLAEINFPPGYLDKDRFGQTQKATDQKLESIITARFRPTSLARFAQGQSFEGARRTGGVNVRVNRGGSKRINRAFFVRLNRGGDTSDGFNLGLAVRLKPGERLLGRRKGGSGVMLAPDLYLLYGPSVDQAFATISTAKSPAVAEELEKQFIRQYVRLTGEN